MTYLAAQKKAKAINVEMIEGENGIYFFESKNTGNKGSAWLQDGSFNLCYKLHNGHDSSFAENMKDLFRYLNK